MSIDILSYNKFSQGAKTLKAELVKRGHKVRILETPSKFNLNNVSVIWGNNKAANKLFERFPREELAYPTILNRYSRGVGVNKNLFFRELPRIIQREWMPLAVFDKASVIKAIKNHKGDGVFVCRTILTGHSGEGIVIVDKNTPEADIPDCKLYTEYIKKKDEYRLHYSGTGRSFLQHKLRNRQAIAEGRVDYRVRNLANGWVYVQDDVTQWPKAKQDAYNNFVQNAIRPVMIEYGMNFGAFDFIYNEAQNRFYLLELNSAPGLGEDTAPFYADVVEEAQTALNKTTASGFGKVG